MASSDGLLEMQLLDAGNKLLTTPVLVDELQKMLDHSETILIKVEQSPPMSILEAITPLIEALTKEELLNYPDTDIKVLVASCLSEIIRITAPEAPFDDEKTKVIFELIVSCFEDLSDCSSHSYSRRARVLETLYKVRFCVVMLDLEMESLITEMFVHFLKAIRDYHPDDIFYSIVQVMTQLLEESELPLGLLSPMLVTLKTDNQDVLPAAFRLSKRVFENCASKLKPFLLEAAECNVLSLEEYNDVVANICGVTCVSNNDCPASKDLPANDENMAPAESTQVHKEIVDHDVPSSNLIVGGSTSLVKSTVSVEDCNEIPSAALETLKKLKDYQLIDQGIDAVEENQEEFGGADCKKDYQHSDPLADSNKAESFDVVKTKGTKIKLKSGKRDGNKPKNLEDYQNISQSVGTNEVRKGPSSNLDSSMVPKSKIYLNLVNMQKDPASGSSNMLEDDLHVDEPRDIGKTSKPASDELDSGNVVTIELKSQSTAQRNSNKPEGTCEATNSESCDLKSIGVAKVKTKSGNSAKRSRKLNSYGSSKLDQWTANDSDVRPKRQQKKKVFFGDVIENISTELNGNTELSLDVSNNRTEGRAKRRRQSKHVPLADVFESLSTEMKGNTELSDDVPNNRAEETTNNSDATPKKLFSGVVIKDISTESNGNTKLIADVSNNKAGGTRNDSDGRPKRQLKKKVFFGDVSEDMSPSLLSSKKRSAKVEKQSVTNEMDESGNMHQPILKRKGGKRHGQLKESSDKGNTKTSSKKGNEEHILPSTLLKLHDDEDHLDDTSKKKSTSRKGENVIQSPKSSLNLLEDENPAEDEECMEENPTMKSKANTLFKVKEVVMTTKASFKMLGHEDRLVKTSKEDVFSSKPSSPFPRNGNSLEKRPKETKKRKQSLKRDEGANIRDEDLLEETPKKKRGFGKKKKVLASLSQSKGKGKGIMEVEPNKTYKRRKREGKEKVVESQEDVDNKSLVGLRVKIWWPQDSEYYEGVIESFNSVSKNHKVLYNDGDMETLILADEKWEIVKDDLEEYAAEDANGSPVLSQLIRKKNTMAKGKRKGRHDGKNLRGQKIPYSSEKSSP